MNLKGIADFLVYSNIYIGLCAAAMVSVSQIWYGQFENGMAYLGFVFFGTILQYGIHRIIGLRRMASPTGRFLKVKKYESTIVLSIGISGLGSILCLTQLSWPVIQLLFLPVALALLYVLPVFGQGRRLRDLPYIKLFVIAFVWSWTTFYIPMRMESDLNYLDAGLMFERIVFLLAITLPFDVRDLVIDQENGQKTLATKLGLRNTKILSQIALFAGVLSLVSICLEHAPFIPYAAVYLPGYFLAYILIAGVQTDRSDYYYSLGLDGTLILLGLGTLISQYLM